MPKQLDLIEHCERIVMPVDPNVRPEDKPRLSKNAAAVLNRLEDGPATNSELMEIGGLRFGARIHDLKRHGYTISSQQSNGGIWVYSLENGK
jgi:hypothetical protein